LEVNSINPQHSHAKLRFHHRVNGIITDSHPDKVDDVVPNVQVPSSILRSNNETVIRISPSLPSERWPLTFENLGPSAKKLQHILDLSLETTNMQQQRLDISIGTNLIIIIPRKRILRCVPAPMTSAAELERARMYNGNKPDVQ
jgi:hypothetical protein